MELAFIVYLIGVLPSIAAAFGFIGFMGSLALIATAIGFLVSGNQVDYYSWQNKEVVDKQRGIQLVWGKRCLKLSLITIFLGLVAALVPSEKTMYTMVAAYAGQKLAETPQAQQLANDSVDILKELLAKAKRELQEDDKKETAK